MPKERGAGQYGRPTYNQARKIVRRFGSEAGLAAAIRAVDAASRISRVTVYRWSYEKPYGTDGLIPSSAIERVQKAARVHGIVLTDKDWMPERIDYSTEDAA